ncbi:MAG TPA: CapA family protein [Candidatus Paceibacterota bacterium]
MERKKLIWIFFIILVTVSFLLIFGYKNEIPINQDEDAQTTTLLFVGDIMLSREIEKIVYKEQDPLYHFLRTAGLTQSTDISFANLEGSVSVRGVNQGSEYSFRTHPDLLKGLAYAGFDIVSVANNHIFDWGPLAFEDTLMYLKQNAVLPVGGGENYNEAHKPVKIEKNGETFCFLAYSQFAPEYISNKGSSPTVARLVEGDIKDDLMQSGNNGCGFITVSLHWGNEYEAHPTVDQREIAHVIIDSGANLIIGHHPHVVQDVEEYKDGVIAYSLGNFIFDQNFSPETREGLIFKVNVRGGSVESFEKIKIHFTDTFQPFVSDSQ